jgi:hypothetical protein
LAHFSEKPPSLERLLARLLAAGGSLLREEWTDPSPPRLPELLRRDRREEGRAPPSCAGVCSSSLNLAVAVTLVTWPEGEEQREELEL